jgi:uncharacterized protein (DUF2062 family)
MAESIAFGVFLGILPLPGLNSVLCAIVAVRRGLNMGVIQAVNWIMLPVQIGMFLPMSRLGAYVLRHQPLPLAFDETVSLLKSGPTAFFEAVGFGFVDATLVWCVLGIPTCFLIFRATRYVLERRADRASATKRVTGGIPAVLGVYTPPETAYPASRMANPISPSSVIGRPLHYIAFWQAMSFIMLICAMWASETLGLLHEGPSNFTSLILPTILLTLGGFVAVSHTYFQEGRILHGLITICSYCRKVKIDQHIWTQVEQFVTQHSRADFTHGVCPECYQKLSDDMTREDAARQGIEKELSKDA